MEVPAQPELLLQSTYIPLGLSQVTRTNFRGVIHLPSTYPKSLRFSTRERLALSTKKIRDFFSKPVKSNLEANSDFVFYTVSSKSHLQPRRVFPEEVYSPELFRNRHQTTKPTSRCSFNRVDWLRTLLFLTWILMFCFVVVYSVVRFRQLEGWSYLLTTTEGYIVLALIGMAVVSGIVILAVILVAVCGTKEEEESLYEPPRNRLSHRVSLETQV